MTTISRGVLYQPVEGCKSTLKTGWCYFIIVLEAFHSQGTGLLETWRAEPERPQLETAYINQCGLQGTPGRFPAPRWLFSVSTWAAPPAFGRTGGSHFERSEEVDSFPSQRVPNKEAAPLGLWPQASSLTLSTLHMTLRITVYSKWCS